MSLYHGDKPASWTRCLWRAGQGPGPVCQVCELCLSEELLLSFQKAHSCIPI